MSEPAFKDTHAAEMAARLYEVLKDRPNLAAVTSALGARVQELEDVFEALYFLRRLDTAQGEQLDLLGRLLLLPRDGRSDTDYRVALKAWVFALKSSGTFRQLIDLMLLIDPDATVTVKPYINAGTGQVTPGAIEIYFQTSLSVADGETAQLVAREARAAGIRVDLNYSPDTANAFTFDVFGGGGTSSTTQGFAEDATPSTGGFFVPEVGVS